MQRETNIRMMQGRETIESAWKLYLRTIQDRFNVALSQTQNDREISE